MKFFQTARIFLEQVEYPEQSRPEDWVVGIRNRRGMRVWIRDKFIYQVVITEEGIRTFWGVEQGRVFGTPNAEELQQWLIGSLIADYPLDEAAFQRVKDEDIPGWSLPPEETLALELDDTPAVFDTEAPIESREYPVVTRTEVGSPERRVDTLLKIVQKVVQRIRRPGPVVVQIVFQGVRAGSTVETKQKKQGGERWKIDRHKIWRDQLHLLERSKGKEEGYWMVTTRILAPRRLKGIEGALNRVFSFRRVKAKRTITRWGRWRFGRMVRMSSTALKRLTCVPTATIFPRELLRARTTGIGVYGRWRTRPFPQEGYPLGWDDHRMPVCLDNRTLRAHTLLVGQTGSRKTSLMRAIAVTPLILIIG